jgi:hypothetical protein
MSDPCKACGAIKCAAYESCQCCGKCRNCGQDFGKHVPSPYVVQPFVIPQPVPVYPTWPYPTWPQVQPWWGHTGVAPLTVDGTGVAPLTFGAIGTTCAGGIPQGTSFTAVLDGCGGMQIPGGNVSSH